MTEENKKPVETTENKKVEEKAKVVEPKKETGPEKKQEIKKVKKTEATIKGLNLSISPKDALHICDMIRGKNIDYAERAINEVLADKRYVRMTSREMPHKHGKGVAGAKRPLIACNEFKKLLKGLRANAIQNELEIEKYVLFCKSDRASRPYRRGGTRFKRCHVLLKLIKKMEKKK